MTAPQPHLPLRSLTLNVPLLNLDPTMNGLSCFITLFLSHLLFVCDALYSTISIHGLHHPVPPAVALAMPYVVPKIDNHLITPII